MIAAALGLAVIIAGRAGSNYLATISFAKVGARIATELRTRVFAHIQALSLRYHSRASIGDTSQRLVGDVGRAPGCRRHRRAAADRQRHHPRRAAGGYA